MFPLNRNLSGLQRLSGSFGEEETRTNVRYEFIDHPISGTVTPPGDKSRVTDIEKYE